MPKPPELVIRAAVLDEIVDLRWTVLRPGLPREAAVFPGDADPTTLHVAAMSGPIVVGCATLHRSQWEGQPAWQLRGMAVHCDFQGRGLGRGMLEQLDRRLAGSGRTLRLWCHAREPAVEFYRRLGWQVVSERFDIPTAGPHFRMVRLPEARS